MAFGTNKTFGADFVRFPDWQFAGNVRYDLRFGDVGVGLFGNYLHKDEYFNYPEGQAARIIGKTGAYSTADFGIDMSPNENFTARLLCKNCTNAYPQIRSTSGSFGPTRAPGVYAYFPELRTLMLEATYRF